jgi:uncharacterized protein
MGLNVKQCKICGKLFQTYDKTICMDCLDEKERSFVLVRDFIYAHPKAAILEICGETGVRERWIMDFLREERLSLNTNDSVLVCEQCGKPILTGRFCKECKNDLQRVFSVEVVHNHHSAGKDTHEGINEKTNSRKQTDDRNFSKSMHLNIRER